MSTWREEADDDLDREKEYLEKTIDDSKEDGYNVRKHYFYKRTLLRPTSVKRSVMTIFEGGPEKYLVTT